MFSNRNNTVWKAKIDIQTNNNNNNDKVDFGVEQGVVMALMGWGGVNPVNNIRSV